MGYDIDRFVGAVNDGLLCSICRDVLEDALQAPCEHAFCTACIHGWLVHESCCPEDRRALVPAQLRPVCRYMRNDLGALRLRCRNAGAGCEAVCALELLATHESACGFDAVPCPSEGCSATAERRRIDEHLQTCPFRRRACPRGCGATMLDAEDEAHSCTGELRTALDLLRSEMICKLEDMRQDAELRLDAQRSHMVQREGEAQTELEALKSQVSRLMQSMKMLAETAEERRKDFERSEREKLEMLEMIKALQQEARNSVKVTCIKCHKSERVTVL